MDNLRKLERTRKGFWSLDEIASILDLPATSARVFCSRATARGDLVRPKRGLYVLAGWGEEASDEQAFALSNHLQTPSYVSLLSALSWAGVSTQVPGWCCEAVNPVRTARYVAEGREFRFVRLAGAQYTGFRRERGFFMAEPEKAFLDALYLASLGRYALDVEALDPSRLDRDKVARFAALFPSPVRKRAMALLGGA